MEMLGTALSVQDMVRHRRSERSFERRGPSPNGRLEMVGCLGLNWDSRWIQYSTLETKKFAMGGNIRACLKGADIKEKTTESFPGLAAGKESRVGK